MQGYSCLLVTDMDYNDFEAEDFLLDESFQKWVKGYGNNIFWETWFLENPEKLETAERARRILLGIEFYEKPLEENEVEQELSFLKERIRQENPRKQLHLLHWNNWRALAASISLLIVAFSAFYYYNYLQHSYYTTGYGETRNILLPDGSKVILNGNSEIKFKRDFTDQNDRIIYLEGEGFFEVTHQVNNQKFIVSTNGIEVTVLGTKFNVNSRRDNVRVVLNSGKVKVSHATNEALYMKPGEMVEYNKKEERYVKTFVQPQLYTSWKNNKLEFKNTPVKEIIQILEDNYGLRVVLQDSAIVERKLTGNYPADNITILLKSMEEVFGLNITQNNKELIVGNNQ
jgi:transmembrane sensor